MEVTITQKELRNCLSQVFLLNNLHKIKEESCFSHYIVNCKTPVCECSVVHCISQRCHKMKTNISCCEENVNDRFC